MASSRYPGLFTALNQGINKEISELKHGFLTLYATDEKLKPSKTYRKSLFVPYPTAEEFRYGLFLPILAPLAYAFMAAIIVPLRLFRCVQQALHADSAQNVLKITGAMAVNILAAVLSALLIPFAPLLALAQLVSRSAVTIGRHLSSKPIQPPADDVEHRSLFDK